MMIDNKESATQGINRRSGRNSIHGGVFSFMGEIIFLEGEFSTVLGRVGMAFTCPVGNTNKIKHFIKGEIMSTETNPKISALLRFLTLVEVVVLFLAGVGIFFLPKVVAPFWPWELLPFNARFLGAVYSAACLAVVVQTVYGLVSRAACHAHDLPLHLYHHRLVFYPHRSI